MKGGKKKGGPTFVFWYRKRGKGRAMGKREAITLTQGGRGTYHLFLVGWKEESSQREEGDEEDGGSLIRKKKNEN